MKIDHPAFDYDRFGQGYSNIRQTEPRIARYVHEALGAAQTVLNVGAGAGSYEPTDRFVLAVEPSATMRAQRRRQGKTPAVDAFAERLPFDDNAFDAAMTLLSVHHWPDLEKGLAELRRVSSGPVVVMCFDPDRLDDFWNARYFPELVAVEKARDPAIERIRAALGGTSRVVRVPIPLDCVDGFQEAYYGRPEGFLNPAVRRAQSAWGFLPEGLEAVLVGRLEADLVSGAWDRQYGHFRTLPEFFGALCLVVGTP